MAQKTVTLTPALLRKIVLEEKRKLQQEAAAKTASDIDVDLADEVDADEYADTLAAKKEHQPKMESIRARYHKLVAEEKALRLRLQRITENKKVIRSRILRSK